MRERPRNLVGARDAGAGDPVRGQPGELTTIEFDAAAGGRVVPADDIDEGRLAGTVGTEQAEDLAPAHVDVDADKRAHTAERLVQA